MTEEAKMAVRSKKEINQRYMVDVDNFNDSPYSNKNYDVDDYKRGLSQIDKIIIHCTATDSEKWDDPIACISMDIKPNSGNPALPKKGCPSATYHYYVNKKGDIDQLVSLNIWTMNCKGYNHESVAICINHGATEDNITDEQYSSLIDAICHVIDVLDFPYAKDEIEDYLFFHRDFNKGKSCPGYFIKKENVIDDVAERLLTWGNNV